MLDRLLEDLKIILALSSLRLLLHLYGSMICLLACQTHKREAPPPPPASASVSISLIFFWRSSIICFISFPLCTSCIFSLLNLARLCFSASFFLPYMNCADLQRIIKIIILPINLYFCLYLFLVRFLCTLADALSCIRKSRCRQSVCKCPLYCDSVLVWTGMLLTQKRA